MTDHPMTWPEVVFYSVCVLAMLGALAMLCGVEIRGRGPTRYLKPPSLPPQQPLWTNTTTRKVIPEGKNEPPTTGRPAPPPPPPSLRKDRA